MQKLESLNACYRRVLPLDLPPTARVVYRSSNNMSPSLPGPPWCGLGNFDVDMPSHDVVIVGDVKTQRFLLVGALTAFRSLTYFTVRRRSGRMVSVQIEQPEIREGQSPEQLMIQEGQDWRELLEDYAQASARAMGVKPIQAQRNLVGYCTWYYYYADVTEADFLDNVAALASHADSPYSRGIAQIDDGYQTFQGDWLDQDASWPTALEKLARKTAAHGLVPGIWLMPMVASTASRVFREHPDWFVRDSQGQPKVFHGWSPEPDHLWACIDPTIPEVREHLTLVFRTFWNWGFRYFKLDGLGFGLPEGRRHDPQATAVSAFRLAMETIRKAVPEAHILGCCPPFMACLGFCDSCRVSGDTGRTWGNVEGACHGTLSNWWMLDRWFRADPDVLMARQDNTSLTLGEARISVLMGVMTGVSLTSDHLNTIADERRRLLDLAAGTRMRTVRPCSWTPDTWCHVWSGTVDGRYAVALVNDTTDPLMFALQELGFDDRAQEVLQGLGGVNGSLTLAPHDAALLIAE